MRAISLLLLATLAICAHAYVAGPRLPHTRRCLYREAFCGFNFFAFERKPSLTACASWCESEPSCRYFTWRRGMSSPESGRRMFQELCMLYTSCNEYTRGCADCITGMTPRACP